MSEKKVNIISKVNHPVSVHLPELRFSRVWEKEGAIKNIDFEVVEEAMSDPGFAYMINSGMLYIEDMAVKKDLDIEPQDAKEPVNIIVYSDDQIKELLSNKKTLKQLENALEKVSEEQQIRIAQKAVEFRLNDLEKAKLLFEYTDLNVAKLVQMALDDDKEEEEEKTTSKKSSTATRRKK